MMKMKRIQHKKKRKFNKYLQRYLANEYRRIILQIRIIGNNDSGVETRRKICSPEQTQLALLSTI
jgi:hypothetical protein